jgi:hypothetical protein
MAWPRAQIDAEFRMLFSVPVYSRVNSGLISFGIGFNPQLPYPGLMLAWVTVADAQMSEMEGEFFGQLLMLRRNMPICLIEHCILNAGT